MLLAAAVLQAALALARKNLRIVLQGRISLFGSPDMVTAQEVDAAFPPLVPLGFRLQHLLALGGWKDENGLFGEANSVAPAENCPANGCGNQGSENQRVVCKILSSEVSRSGVVNLVGTAGTGETSSSKASIPPNTLS